MKACGITDVGLQRHENQDTFAVERGAADGQLVAVVCDGMGGENCGQIASSLAVRAFLDELHAVLRADMTTEQLREAVSFCVSKANAAVNRHAQEHTECHGMGTTLVSAVTNGSGAVICNVGDSRIYLQRGGALQRISRDHTKYQERLDAGAAGDADDADDSPDRHVLTQYLGMLGARQRLMPYFAAGVPLAVGDRLLLCTDGLTGKLSDSRLQAVLGADMPLPELGQALMAHALDAGPGDNITLVLIEVTALDPETAVPLPQPPVEELSQTRRFEVSAERIAEQETQRKKQARARRREGVLTVSVILAVLCAVVAALWIAVGSIPRKPPAPAPTPVQTAAPTPSPTPNAPPQGILPPMPTPDPEPAPEPTVPEEPAPAAEPTGAPEITE